MNIQLAGTDKLELCEPEDFDVVLDEFQLEETCKEKGDADVPQAETRFFRNPLNRAQDLVAVNMGQSVRATSSTI